MGYANYGLRFLLELAALGSLAYWGFAENGWVAEWPLGLGAPLVAAVVWGRFVAPKASHPTTDPQSLTQATGASIRCCRPNPCATLPRRPPSMA